MFDHYGNKTECYLRIWTADDSKDSYHSVLVDIYSTYKIEGLTRTLHSSRSRGRIHPNEFAGYYDDNPRAHNDGYTFEEIKNRKVIDCHIQRAGLLRKGEPLILAIKDVLQARLGWGARSYNKPPKEFKMAIVLPDSTPTMAVMIEKGATYYKLMNHRMRKKNLLVALSRYLYRSCFEEDGQVLLQYLIKMINLPENVSYVLENRTPYWYFNVEEREKVEVRLKTKMIGEQECALEISDGIWAPLSINELDIFINYFYHGHTRAKRWAHLSPKKLWTELMGSPPSSSQLKLMMEFLVQNRTQDIVEDRAKQLMANLEIKYPNRIKLIKIDRYTIMLVKGKACDWAIINSTYKTKIQKVKTYAYIANEHLGSIDRYTSGRVAHKKAVPNFLSGQLRGPICIDNIHSNSSLGDQYAARALALLNDTTTIKLVNTIAKYLPQNVIDNEAESRFPFELGEETPEDIETWRIIL